MHRDFFGFFFGGLLKNVFGIFAYFFSGILWMEKTTFTEMFTGNNMFTGMFTEISTYYKKIEAELFTGFGAGPLNSARMAQGLNEPGLSPEKSQLMGRCARQAPNTHGRVLTWNVLVLVLRV